MSRADVTYANAESISNSDGESDSEADAPLGEGLLYECSAWLFPFLAARGGHVCCLDRAGAPPSVPAINSYRVAHDEAGFGHIGTALSGCFTG
ncbi:MAG: hypothetical protein ACKVVP_03055 [Chloroflexota bacterium]